MSSSERFIVSKEPDGLSRTIKGIVKNLVPHSIRRWYWHREQLWPLPGWVRFGSLRRVKPICTDFGFTRGEPLVRYYIEKFLATHASDIRGRVLEIGDHTYTIRFGGERVTQSDVLHPDAGYTGATFTADLADAPQIPDNSFDCIILTETMLFIYDYRAAIRTLHRILKPGGVVLVTLSGISQHLATTEADHWEDYWRFTSHSARRIFGEVFAPDHVEAKAYGNVLAAIGMLHGLAQHEFTKEELDYHDPRYECSVAVRAIK